MQIFKRTLSTLLAVCLCAGTLAGAFPPQAAKAASPVVKHDNGIEMAGSCSLGNILAQAVADSYETGETEAEESLTSISSIDMEYGKAYVTFMTVCDASLVAALYDEATGRMIASASAMVASGDSDAVLTFDTMPEDYFVVKGYLVDPVTQAPLSKVYESMAFTKEQQEFYAMTPDDFDSERVLMLDDASNENFAVFNENVLLLQSNGESNVIASSDVQNGVYTIEHADETLLNLKSGDIFSLDFGEEFPLLVYADTVTVDEDTVTVTAGDAPLDAYFEFFRLDSGYCEPDYATAGLADGVTVVDRGQTAKSSAKLAGASDTAAEEEKTEEGDQKEEEKDKIDFNVKMKYSVDGEGNEVFTITDGLTINLTEYKLGEISEEPSFISKSAEVKGDAKITGKIDCDISARLKLNLNKNNTGNTFVSLEMINKISPDVSLSGNLSATMSLLKDKDKPIEIPLKAGFKLKAKPEIKVEGNAAIDLNYSVTKTVGFSYDETREDKLTEIKETQKDEVKFSIDGSVYIGINLHPSIVWMHEKVFLADVKEFSGGLILTGKLVDVSADVSNEDIWLDDMAPTVSGSLIEKTKEKHACKICIDGELKVQFKIKMKIHIFDLTQGEDESETKPDEAEKEPDGPISLVIPELAIELPGIHLTYFYLSLMDEEGNAQLKFAFTKCPNRMFLCDISCMDDDTFEAITDAKLVISNTDGQQLNTELKEDGKAWVWMPLGSYTIVAESENYTPSEKKYTLSYRSFADEKSTDMNAEKYALAINGKKTQSITQMLTPAMHKVVVKVINEKGEELNNAKVLCSYASKAVLKQNAERTDTPFGGSGFNGNLLNELIEQNSALNHNEEGYLLPDGTHKFTVSCEGYLTEVAEAVVDGKDMEIVVELEKPEVSWQDLYREVLLDLIENGIEGGGPFRFGFVYVNDDELPELVVSTGWAYVDNCRLYTVVDDEVVFAQGRGFGAEGRFQYLERKDIYIAGSRYGATIYKLDGTEIQSLFNYRGDMSVDGETVTESEYYAVYDLYWKDSAYKTAEFPYDLNVETVYEVFPKNKTISQDSLSSLYSSPLAKSPITTGENTAEFTDLTPDTLYNFYCMKSYDAEDPLGGDNLLYIDQVTSDENGDLAVGYLPKESCEDADVFVVAADGTIAVYGESADDSIEPVPLKPGDTTTVDASGELISSDPTVVEVGEDGVLTAVGEGMAAIFTMDAESGTLVTVIEVKAPDCGKGDLDNDGAVNAVDAAILLVAAAAVGSGGDSGLTEAQETAADVNEDGDYNAVDAAMILQYAAAVGSGYAGTFDEFFAA